MFQCRHIVPSQKMPDQNRPVSWSIVMNVKQTLGSPLFGSFPSDHIRDRRRMSVNISSFTVAINVNYTSEFWEHFEAPT